MKRRSLLAAAGVTVLVVGLGTITNAASAAVAVAVAPVAATHCAVMAETGALACFSTMDQVEEWAFDAPATAPTWDASRGIATWSMAAASTGSYLHAIFYEKNNKTGDSLSLYGDSACDGSSDWDFGYARFSAVGWNDKISSFQAYSNCEVRLYENATYNTTTPGATYGPSRGTNYVGDAMNDKASSARFY